MKKTMISSATSVERQQEREILLNELNDLYTEMTSIFYEDMTSIFERLDKLSVDMYYHFHNIDGELDGEVDEEFKEAYDSVEESVSMLGKILNKIQEANSINN